jgi:NADPH-dependent curcumin reductase CurA
VINCRVVLRSRPAEVPAPTDPAYAQSVPKALEELHSWVRSGDLVVLENLTHGIDEAPAAFCRLMSGQTIGKTLVALDGAA